MPDKTAAQIREEMEQDAMARAKAILGEAFPNYCILADGDDGLTWSWSSRTFTMGACERMRIRLDEEDRLAARDNSMCGAGGDDEEEQESEA